MYILKEPPTFIGAEPKPVEAPKPVKQIEEEVPPIPVSINKSPSTLKEANELMYFMIC